LAHDLVQKADGLREGLRLSQEEIGKTDGMPRQEGRVINARSEGIIWPAIRRWILASAFELLPKI
jgi:hypothetical protein